MGPLAPVDTYALLSNQREATETVTKIHHWVDKNIVAEDVRPRHFPADLRSLFNDLHQALDGIKLHALGSHEFASSATSKFLAKEELTSQEFYYLRYLGLMAVSGETEFERYQREFPPAIKSPSI